MLMKYVSVSKEGLINFQGNPKFLYSTMMSTRLGLMQIAPLYLAKALTIGIRYAIVRT